MPATRVADTEANEPSTNGDACHVHRTLPDWLLSGTKAVHNLQPGLPDRRLADLLQWRGQLHLLGQLRGTSLRERLKQLQRAGVDPQESMPQRIRIRRVL